MSDEAKIIALCDAGHVPGAIAATLSLPAGKVYTVLRRERPDRKRAPRTRTSDVPTRVRALYLVGIKPKRIAALCSVSNAYVYRILSENAV
jgi:hypothetical protein